MYACSAATERTLMTQLAELVFLHVSPNVSVCDTDNAKQHVKAQRLSISSLDFLTQGFFFSYFQTKSNGDVPVHLAF